MNEEQPAAEFDGPWKEALEHALPLFLRHFLADLFAGLNWSVDHEFLHQELQRLAPASETGLQRVDLLVKAFKPDGDPVYLHIEVQMHRESLFSWRMEDYRGVIRHHYRQPVVGIAILGDDDPSWEPTAHEEGEFGVMARYTFRVVKLWR